MILKIAAIYHIPLQSQFGIWTINPLKGHLVLKVPDQVELGAPQ